MRKKHNIKPSEKQVKALQLIREGVRPTVAMRQVGYSEQTSRDPGRNLLGATAVESIIEQYKAEYLRVGITPKYLAKKTREWLDAQKLANSQTEPERMLPDYQTQIKAAEFIRKDLGLTTNQTTEPENLTRKITLEEFIK